MQKASAVKKIFKYLFVPTLFLLLTFFPSAFSTLTTTNPSLYNGLTSLFENLPTAYAASGHYSLDPDAGPFYVGRQFEVRVYITTDEATNAADFIIHYDDTKLQVQDMDPSTAGVQIQPGDMYPSYPNNGNSASGGDIILTGFTADPNGVLQGGGTGWFATIRFLVLDIDAAGTDVTFEFTGVGQTTDSNISDLAGIDMLDAVHNGHYVLLEDTTDPYFSNWNPAHGATDVPVTSNVSFRVNDDESGVDITTVTATIDGVLYSYGDPEFSYSCTRANYDVVPHCDVTINPPGQFPYDYDVTVALYAEDLAANPGVPPIPDHNSATDNYSFHTEFDLNPPYVTGLSPACSSSGAGTDTNITFHLRDNETGVEISSVAVTVDGVVYTATGTHTFTYSGSPSDYFITINPDYDFDENEIIFLQIDARDRATQWGAPAYNWLHQNCWFVTADTQAPWVDRRVPDQGANTGVNANDPITFHVNDVGVGVDIATVQVIVNNVVYTSADFTYTGGSSDYFISIDAPAGGWVADSPVAVAINACDFSHNCMVTDSYAFIILHEECPICPVCEVCETCDTCEVCETCDTCDTCETCDEDTCITKYVNVDTSSTEYKNSDVYKERLDRANAALAQTQIVKFNGHDFDGKITLWFARRVKLEGTSAPGTTLHLRFDDEKFAFEVPVDENGNWELNIKNRFGWGNHKVYATAEVSGVQSESKELGTFYVFPIWILVVAGLSVWTIYRYLHNKHKEERLKEELSKKVAKSNRKK